ncbi:MAG: methionine adenosyltransferase [Proteobacteria bacterium SG_bin7]|nr:MAG: methionine adenosyltransferase [Proteobacteria bacterium SG_bin7]
MSNYLFSSESVSEGHPDKVADQVSDSVLDKLLSQDPKSRVACETLVTTGLCMVSGEVTTKGVLDVPELVRGVIKDIGYDESDMGFDYRSCAVVTSLNRQSPDIAMGVDTAENKEQGAGDQGIMFGYAVNETPEMMPLTISLAHKLLRGLAELRKSKKLKFLRPDSKSQVTIEYENDQPKRIDAIVLSTQHSPDVNQAQIKDALMEELFKKVVPSKLLDNKTKYFVNPTGRFVVGGPAGDCGLTGRKIIVDTYGGHGAHGGGAFSGKDPSKVDRSAAYAARHIAKNIVASGAASKCLVQVAYAIGVAEPVSIYVNEYSTSKVGGDKLSRAIRELWSLKPADIIREYDLLKPIYRKTSNYGHFGREDQGFAWEKTDKVNVLKDFLKI